MSGIMRKTKNTVDKIYDTIRAKILTDEYRAGQKISENTLAEEYRCSRTPIREVLKRLEGDGLVVVKPKSGTYVKYETAEDFTELMQVRAYLESLAVNLCLGKITDREIKNLKKTKRTMDALIENSPIDMMRFAAEHYDFHLQIVRVAGNDLLERLFERLNLRSSHMFYHLMTHDSGLMTQNEHKHIVKYLRSGDPAGEEFMKMHLLNKIKRFIT